MAASHRTSISPNGPLRGLSPTLINGSMSKLNVVERWPNIKNTPSTTILRLAKLKGMVKLRMAANHNRRTNQLELGATRRINASRSHLNYSLAGADSPQAIVEEAKALLKAAGIAKLRKDCVLAVEVLYSLPVNHTVNLGTFFEDCLTWTRANFGGVVLSFDVHLDESMPHAHALILPLIDGHMNGSDMVGNKYDLQLMHMSFHEVVGVLHALEKPANKPLGQAKLDTCRDVLDMLRSDPAMESQIWLPIRDSICNDPSPFAHVLGIQVTKPKARKERSFVDIMISKGKGSNIRESDTR